MRTALLVEGLSDRVAVETLAARRGRDLEAEGVAVVSIEGAGNISAALDRFGPQGLGVEVAGLYDAGEEEWFRRALEHAGYGSGLGRPELEQLGFFVCVEDLEDELIRALGAPAVEAVVAEQGELRPFRTLQNQPAQRGWTIEAQLKRFLGTHSGRKAQYAEALVNALDLDRAPRPLDLLLARVG
jgi:hypothetical protein